MPQSKNISMHFTNDQFAILLNLYKSSFSNFDSLSNLQNTIVKTIVEGLQISRASIWAFESSILSCEKLFDKKKKSFIEQFDLEKKTVPTYFNALQSGLAITANDAQNDKITSELNDAYLIPLNIKSILDVPLRENGKLVGILCCENVDEIKFWSENDMAFARLIADIYGIFIEEYKRRLVEKTLLENQERFKFISENISDGIYIIENEKLVFASKTYLDMIGMSNEEKNSYHNRDMFHLVHPDDVEMVKNTIYTAAEQKKPFVKYSHRCKRKDGSYMWREDIMNIHYDISGHAFRAVTIARDITAEKEVEIENEKRKIAADLQNKLLLQLYTTHSEDSLVDKIKTVTILAVEGLVLDRSSFWKIKDNVLICENLFDKQLDEHSKDQILQIRDIPKYIEAINNQTAIVADDVYALESTSELIDNYLKPLGITDMLDVPIRANGKFHGVLCCEHRDDPRIWSENDIAFARALADYLSLAVEEDKRKKAEFESFENQKKFEFISQNTSDGIIILENSKITYVSPTFEKLSGYNLEFVKNLGVEDLFNFIHPEDIIKIKDTIYQNLENKISKYTYEYRFLATDSKYYWREDSVSVLYKENSNEYSKYIIISRDIQERKETELKLIENEQQFRLIFENSTDGFVVIENHKVKYVSPSYRDLLGFSGEEVTNFPVDKIYDLVHPEDKIRVYEKVRENVSKQVPTFTLEFRIKGGDGNYHWREDLANVLYNKDGSYYKYIINSRNIDERKEIEEQLIESEKQLRLITENTSDGVAVIENGQLTYVSPSFSSLLGYDKDFYKQMTLEDVFKNIHPDDLQKVKETVYGGLANQKREIKYEHRFKGADGTYHWREDSANVIYDKTGKYVKYIVVTRDISARKESEKEKNRLYKITEKQNEKLINFTHIVSHDIRSHTSNLSMILDLYEEAENIEEQKEYFKMLKQSTDKLSDTIYFLNETVAVQSGIKSEKKLLNLKDEIEKALVGINAIVMTNNAEILIDVNKNIEIVATQSYLESIIFNLLTNAIKYKSPERNPKITIKAAKIADEVKLSISDNGLGIDLGINREKIFGMYKTFHGNTDAVGLGLFMVKNHMDSMGGRIEVESEINKGTTFNLYFL